MKLFNNNIITPLVILMLNFILIIFLFYFLYKFIKSKKIFKKANGNLKINFKKINVSWEAKKKQIFFLKIEISKLKMNKSIKKISNKSVNFKLTYESSAFNLGQKIVYSTTKWMKERKFEIFCSNNYIYIISNDRSNKYVYKYSQILELIYINHKKILISFVSDKSNRPIFLYFKKSNDLIHFIHFIKTKNQEENIFLPDAN